MQILIAYNEPVLPPTHPESESEREILDVVDAIAAYLDRPGVKLRRFGVAPDFVPFRDVLRHTRPNVVLNLFEGFGDDPNSECEFARLLEGEGIPFTGASPDTMSRAGRKHLGKQAFLEAGLATPHWMVVKTLPFADWQLDWPVIVKPAFRDASVGIDQSCIVTGHCQLAERVARTADQYGLPVLVEEFIEGREVSVAIFDWPELSVLPIVETTFAAGGSWPIDSYDAKWQPGSNEHEAKSLSYPANLAPDLTDRIVSAARTAYRAVDGRGFATIDMRIRNNMPYLLELNPNADVKPSTCLTGLLRLAGIEYTDFIWQMVLKAATATAVLDRASA